MQHPDPKPDTAPEPGYSSELEEITQQPVPPKILHLAQRLQRMLDDQSNDGGSLN